MGANDEAEMRAELMGLMERGAGTYENVLNQAEQDKKNANESLQDKLRRRKQANADKLAAKKAEFDHEMANMDIEQIVEQEK